MTKNTVLNLCLILLMSYSASGQTTNLSPFSGQRYGHAFPSSGSFQSFAPQTLDSLSSQPTAGYTAGQTCPPGGCRTCEPCNSCVRSPCDESGRCYAFEFNELFYYRRRQNDRALQQNPLVPSERISASQFDFGFAPGIDAAMIFYGPQEGVNLEFRGTWLDDWFDRVRQSFSGATVQFNSNPVVGTTGPRNGVADYESRFLSAEVNARYPLSDCYQGVTFLTGFRTMRVGETLNAAFADPVGIRPVELVQTETTNRLFGLQVGVDSVFINRSNMCLKLISRAGLYGNDGNQRSNLVSLATPPVTFGAGGGEGDFAFHIELGATGRLRMCKNLNLLAGYRILFVDGLALASQQLAGTDFLTRTGYQNTDGLLMQGATVGLEFTW